MDRVGYNAAFYEIILFSNEISRFGAAMQSCDRKCQADPRELSALKGINRKGRLFMKTILLLTISNIFMTFAWYGHLKFKDKPLFIVIIVSWLIAFAEYCFQVPANRIGHGTFTAAQLKTIQEVVTLLVFCAFSLLYLKEPLKWNYIVGFSMIIGAVFFIFYEW